MPIYMSFAVIVISVTQFAHSKTMTPSPPTFSHAIRTHNSLPTSSPSPNSNPNSLLPYPNSRKNLTPLPKPLSKVNQHRLRLHSQSRTSHISNNHSHPRPKPLFSCANLACIAYHSHVITHLPFLIHQHSRGVNINSMPYTLQPA